MSGDATTTHGADGEGRTEHLEHEVRIAARALLQQQSALARAERLAATGELAASLAHDLRNPLASVQAAIGNLRNDLEDESHRERLDLVLAELKRMATRLNELLDAARQPPESPREIDLHDTVDTIAGLAAYQLPDPVRIEIDIPSGLNCRLPEGGLRQAILNLIVNAANAIGSDAGIIRIGARVESGELAITVRDDGPGFDGDVLEWGPRAFSTSNTTGGTGLGLATVRRFARDLGGDLVIENNDGGGACVTIRMPVHCSTHGSTDG